MDRGRGKLPNVKDLVVFEQHVKHGTVLLFEHAVALGKELLHLADALPDADGWAVSRTPDELTLEVRRRREMVSVRVRLENHVDPIPLLLDQRQQRIRRSGSHGPGGPVVVEDRVDDDGGGCRRVGDDVLPRPRLCLEQGMHGGLLRSRSLDSVEVLVGGGCRRAWCVRGDSISRVRAT